MILNNLPKIVMVVVLVIFFILIITVGCVPAKVETPSQVGNMKLLAQQNDIQVWKLLDSTAGVLCYVTINSRNYEPAGIFCLK